MLLAEGHAQEQAEAFGDVIGEPVTVEHRDHVILIGHEARFGDAGEVILQSLALIGEDQARRVKAVAPEHAAHGVGEELGHGVGAQAGLVRGGVVLDAIAIGGVAGEGDLFDRHLRGQLVLQTIGVDEDAVVLFLQPLHLVRHALPMGAEGGVAVLQRLAAMLGREQRERGEIPGGFVGVPVCSAKRYKVFYSFSNASFLVARQSDLGK